LVVVSLIVWTTPLSSYSDYSRRLGVDDRRQPVGAWSFEIFETPSAHQGAFSFSPTTAIWALELCNVFGHVVQTTTLQSYSDYTRRLGVDNRRAVVVLLLSSAFILWAIRNYENRLNWWLSLIDASKDCKNTGFSGLCAHVCFLWYIFVECTITGHSARQKYLTSYHLLVPLYGRKSPLHPNVFGFSYHLEPIITGVTV
jgi:hypothetical protein